MRNGYFAVQRVGNGPNEAMVTDTFRDTVAMMRQDAEFIVKAVNSHQGLVDALNDVLDAFPNFEFSTKERDALYLKIKTAMKEADAYGKN